MAPGMQIREGLKVMMKHEFENLTGLIVTIEEYEVIEKSYMKSKLDKHTWCKRYTSKQSVIKKDYLKTIIESIREVQGNVKYYNSRYKQLIKRQIKQAKELGEYYEPALSSLGTWENFLPSWLRDSFQKERSGLLQYFDPEASYYFVYRDGSNRCFNSEEILTGEATRIKLSGIVYAHMNDPWQEIDTETGELNYDYSEDDQLAAHEEYMNNIERKYKTEWGLKHPA